MPNPFIPFQIATGEGFVNRAVEIQTIMERLAKGASSAIVGNPHIGKSSLLRRLYDPEITRPFLAQPESYFFVESDFQLLKSNHTPNDFWRPVLEQIVFIGSQQVKATFQPLLKRKTFDEQILLSAFSYISRAKQRVVLLIDELDYLFNLPGFNTLDFLGPLRVLVMKSGGLAVVTASRLSVAELSAQAEKLKDQVRGSDLFNYLEEVPVGSFSPADVHAWLQQQNVSNPIIEEILLLAGQHPLLLQLAGELYSEADLSNDRIRSQLRANFIRKAEIQFQDVWDYLNPKAQVALVIFTLDQLNNRLPSGERFSLEQKERYLTWYDTEVARMVRQGTLETSATGAVYIGSQAFLQWIFEHKIIGTRGEQLENFTQWLRGQQYKLGGLVTQEEIDWLQKVWQKIPNGLIDLARKAILPESLR